MARRISLLLVVLSVVAAACSDDDGTVTTPDQPVPSVVSPSTTTNAPATATSAGPTTAPARPGTTTTEPPPVTTGAPGTTTTTTTTALAELELALDPVADGFGQPVLVTAPEGDPRLFVVDQPGRIWVIAGDEVHEFLDIRDAVRFQNEQGLLGLAFHPDYEDNGLFYVDYTNLEGDSVLVEFRVDPGNPDVALADSRREVLTVAQPAGNHNGGMIAFGPDGLLWFGLGDGGAANDRFGNGQRADRLLASMIRLRVGPGVPEPYAAPTDGPFVASGGLPEVWAVGLRNPWRWAFDGDVVYIADVGQAAIEEINVVSADRGGINFGWPILEGDECFQASSCDRTGLEAPVLTYTHAEGCSITGGFVYRGTALPELAGHYFFGDFCGGWIDSIVAAPDGRVSERYAWFPRGTVSGLTSFGIDSRGEIYVMSAEGTVYRITRG